MFYFTVTMITTNDMYDTKPAITNAATNAYYAQTYFTPCDPSYYNYQRRYMSASSGDYNHGYTQQQTQFMQHTSQESYSKEQCPSYG